MQPKKTHWTNHQETAINSFEGHRVLRQLLSPQLHHRRKRKHLFSAFHTLIQTQYLSPPYHGFFSRLGAVRVSDNQEGDWCPSSWCTDEIKIYKSGMGNGFCWLQRKISLAPSRQNHPGAGKIRPFPTVYFFSLCFTLHLTWDFSEEKLSHF